MESNPATAFIKKEPLFFDHPPPPPPTTTTSGAGSSLRQPIRVPSSSCSSSSYSDSDNDNDNDKDSASNNQMLQMVVYESPSQPRPPPPPPRRRPFTSSSDILPSVGALTVQCAKCFKWRLIPSKERYEEIRENILELPFFCETAREWRPLVSCDDPPDISPDGTRLWAIDKPSIAQPPPGWQRLLRIRGQGSSKFADVYYMAPSGKTLRSMVEIQRYLTEHPEFMGEGVSMDRFSFQIPRPLQENYVRKRPRITGGDNPRPLDSGVANCLTSVGTDNQAELPLPALPAPPSIEAPVPDHSVQPTKRALRPTKQAKKSPKKRIYSSKPADDQEYLKVD